MLNESRSGSRLISLLHQFWQKHPIVILAFLFVVAYSAILIHIKTLNVQLVQQSVTDSSRQYTEVISQFRAL